MIIQELYLQIHSCSEGVNANTDSSCYLVTATKLETGGNIPEKLIAVVTATKADKSGYLASAQCQGEELATLITYLTT